ncbi:hypothetical protein THRCLA_22735 [Thraustotheca clavata]|uniref:Uncharacterized protein n=1 Tax=Thraustotheca clavata TaxID=74557 RepID=A0A1V9YTZ1_9STRA|nr:hypothetical protein THRCLA_22735 [Thraustotheca clavata]
MTQNFDLNVFCYREAIPAINNYLSTIKINIDNPNYFFSWNMKNLRVFLVAANTQQPKDCLAWLHTLLPSITSESLINDIVGAIGQVAGGSCGLVLLAPNNLSEFVGISYRLREIELSSFMQKQQDPLFHLSTITPRLKIISPRPLILLKKCE